MTVLKFKLKATFGHMRRLEGTTVKQTYKVPPKTTIIGMLAGLLGRERDSYYNEFGDWEVSIVPHYIRTMDIPTLLLSTNNEIKEISSNGVKIGKGVHSKSSRNNRQRTPVEYLVDPEYTIYVKSNGESEVLEEISRRISDNKYHYTPTLGISECLCELTDSDIVEIFEVDSKKVDSIAPESKSSVEPQNGNTLSFERVAQGFEKIDNGRKPTGFESITVDINCNKLTVDSDNVHKVPDTEHNIITY